MTPTSESLPGIPRIETIAIGDELLTGKIADTNSAFVAGEFFRRGYPLQRTTVVADDFNAMKTAILESGSRADVVVVFGGLGPTTDDRTAECVARMLGTKLVEHPPSKTRLYERYKELGRTINDHSLKQVLYPEACEPLANAKGMAPGFRCRFADAVFFFLPGVPLEMRVMFENSVIPYVKEKLPSQTRVWSRTWKLIGIGESDVQKMTTPIEATMKEGEWLGYRTRFPENHLSLYLKGGEDVLSRFVELSETIRKTVKPWTYTEEPEELEEMILRRLHFAKMELVLAESCTGGLVSQRLTRVPGASAYLWGGYNVYKVEAKEAMLDVALSDPEEAVSESTTRRLAENAKKKSGCDVAAAVTGYLGPTGGTKENPVGTIYVCVIGKKRHERKILLPSRHREEAQWGAATWVLREILSCLESEA